MSKQATAAFTLVPAFVFVLACARSSLPTAPSVSSPTVPSLALHSEVSDTSGDALKLQLNPPDLVNGTVDVLGGSITFKVRLTPGTFNPQATRLYIAFDTDQNASTGVTVWGIGMDYDAWLYAIGSWAQVRRRTSTGLTNIGTVSASSSADGMDVTIPLSFLGDDDGKLDFQVHSSGDPSVIGQVAAILDFMPDLSLPPGRIQ